MVTSALTMVATTTFAMTAVTVTLLAKLLLAMAVHFPGLQHPVLHFVAGIVKRNTKQ